jgi:hypothetical protein
VINENQHDDGIKTFLGRTGNLNGIEVIEIIMEQPVTAEYIANKIYRFFVGDDPDPGMYKALGNVLRDADFEIAVLRARWNLPCRPIENWVWIIYQACPILTWRLALLVKPCFAHPR